MDLPVPSSPLSSNSEFSNQNSAADAAMNRADAATLRAVEAHNAAQISTATPEVTAQNVKGGAPDLDWVWKEVRKRVFLKLPFSNHIADALEAVRPITLENDCFVVGLSPRNMPLACQLTTQNVKNTIENILSSASHRPIHFEVIEGQNIADWEVVRDRRSRAHEAVVAMAQKQSNAHHFDDVLNQIVSEIRSRVTCSKDRALPQVRAQMMLDVVPSLADAEEMLFPDPDSHEARRAIARALDRVASFLEIQPIYLAIEVERYRREHHQRTNSNSTQS